MIAASPAAELETLKTLEPDRLYVFVVGPGSGEGLAVALPNRGWLVIDGCKTRDSFPVRELFERFRRGTADTIECLVWTHPHLDHAAGVAAIVSELAPSTVGVTGLSVRESLVKEHAVLAARDRRVTSDEGRAGPVHQAMTAILRLAEDEPAALLPLHAGVAIPVTASEVRVTVQAPSKTGLKEWADRLRTVGDLFDRANQVSAVLEIEFGTTRVVLGGDLPHLHAGGASIVPTGWNEVLSRRPELGSHVGLKLPHHGSPAAYHPKLHTAGSAGAWWVTPFNSSRLPGLNDLEGLPKLVARRGSVELTALPASRQFQSSVVAPGGIVRIDQLGPRLGTGGTGIRFIDEALRVKPEREPNTFEPVWCGAFDAEGELRARYRGAVACSRPGPAAHREALADRPQQAFKEESLMPLRHRYR